VTGAGGKIVPLPDVESTKLFIILHDIPPGKITGSRFSRGSSTQKVTGGSCPKARYNKDEKNFIMIPVDQL
jgi:hypothetical protein